MSEGTTASLNNLAEVYPIDTANRYSSILNQIGFDVGPKASTSATEYLLKNKGEFDMPVLSELKRRSDVATIPRHEQVRKGRGVLEQFFNQKDIRWELMMMGGIPLYYGSVQYDDPRNFDPDVLILHTNSALKPDHERVSQISDLLSEYWWENGLANSKKSNESHTSAIDLVDVFSSETYISLNHEDLYDRAGDLSIVLSGKPVLNEHQNQLKTIRRTIGSTKYDPLEFALVNVHLKECLDIRTERQGIK